MLSVEATDPGAEDDLASPGMAVTRAPSGVEPEDTLRLESEDMSSGVNPDILPFGNP